jgi:hypothetical protein
MYLYSHIWKSFVRNERWRRNILARIFYIFFGLNVIFLYLSFGYDYSSSLAKEGVEAAGKFYQWILWYLFADYLIRCMMQSVPSLEVKPYLRLRIRRKKLANNLIVRSYFNLFNILPLFLVMPFAIMVLAPSQGAGAALLFITGSLLLLILNNMLALMTGMLIRINPLNWLLPLGTVAVAALLNSLTGMVNELSRALGASLTDGKLLTFAATAGLIILSIRIIYLLVHGYLYVDRSGSQTNLRATGVSFTGRFSRLGDAGRYMSLEISMLLRNKRPRNTMLIVPFFFIYAVVYFILNDSWQGGFFTILIANMLIGLGSTSYAQYLFSWESTYFDGIMARKNDFTDYVKAKYYLQVLITLITFLPLAVVIAVSGRMNMFLLIALLLFNLGPNSFIVMILALLNDARIDLGAGTFLNYQGMKGSQFVMTFLFVLIPVLTYLLIEKIANETTAIMILASLGIIFIAFSNWWLEKYIASAFLRRKYKSLEGYRKLSA